MYLVKYQCIHPANFNDPHTHTYRTCPFFIFFLRKNLSNINLLKLANFKNPHTYIHIYIYIYMQPAKYQCTQPANLKNPHTYIYMQSTYITINIVFRRLVHISNYNKVFLFHSCHLYLWLLFFPPP